MRLASARALRRSCSTTVWLVMVRRRLRGAIVWTLTMSYSRQVIQANCPSQPHRTRPANCFAESPAMTNPNVCRQKANHLRQSRLSWLENGLRQAVSSMVRTRAKTSSLLFHRRSTLHLQKHTVSPFRLLQLPIRLMARRLPQAAIMKLQSGTRRTRSSRGVSRTSGNACLPYRFRPTGRRSPSLAVSLD